MSASPFLYDYLYFYFHRIERQILCQYSIELTITNVVALVWSQDTGCTVSNSNTHRQTQMGRGPGLNCLHILYTRISLAGASLVAQWLRIHLPMQGTPVRALVREDPTCRGATKPVRHNYWAWALEPASHNYWACVSQLLKPTCLEPVLHNKRSHCNKKPAHRNRVAPARCN